MPSNRVVKVRSGGDSVSAQEMRDGIAAIQAELDVTPDKGTLGRIAARVNGSVVEATLRGLVDERQVVAHGGDAGLVGDRPVTGDNRVDVHAEHEVARRDPVRRGRP